MCISVLVLSVSLVLPTGNRIVIDNARTDVYRADLAADAAWNAAAAEGRLPEYQREVRAKVLESIGALPAPYSTALTYVNTFVRDGYTVKTVRFESERSHHVTGELFLPDAAKYPGRRAGILLVCGHSNNGKACTNYQRGALLAAQRGMVVLIVDPIDQGERRQSRGDDRIFNVHAHNRIGHRAELLGWSAARFRVRDAVRALDCLAALDCVDPERLGVMGHSGGGTMTSWTMCLDDRIRCAAPSGFLSTARSVCEDCGPQDAEQYVFGGLACGFNHLGHILLRAPSPVLMCTSHGDFFPILGSYETARRAAEVYRVLGRADSFALSDTLGPHAWHESTRHYAVDWMDRFLQGGVGVKTMQHYRDLEIGFDFAASDCGLTDAEALATPTGHTLDLPGERTVYDQMKDEADRQRAARGRLSIEAVRRVAGIRAPAEIGFTTLAGGKVVRMDDGTPVVLRDDAAEEDVVLSSGGRTVSVDVRGRGENCRGRAEFYGAKEGEEELAQLYHLVGRKIVGLRAEDLIAAAKTLGGGVRIRARGKAAIFAAHAYYTAPELFVALEIVNRPASWGELLADDAMPWRFADIVRGAWAYYDWTDLAAR